MFRMIFTATAVLALLTPAALQAQDAADLSGTWNLIFDTPRGEQTFVVELAHAGEELTGTLTLPRGQESEVKDASFVDGILTFTVEMGMGQRSMTHRFEGTLEEGILTGEMQREGAPAMGGRRGPPRGGGQARRPAPGPRSFKMVRAGG